MNIKKIISSSITEDIPSSIEIANDLSCGIEISRIPKQFNINKDFDQVKLYLKEKLKNFQNIITVHGLFFDLNIASRDEGIRELSQKRYYQSLELAKELNATTLLFHTGKKTTKHKDSQRKFKDNTIKFWESFIKDIEKTHITVVLENVQEADYTFINDIISHINSNQLKASLDTGHVNVHSDHSIVNWIKGYNKNLYHMHLHNNFKDDDSHYGLKEGSINFEQIIDTLFELELYPLFVFEIFKIKDLISSIELFDKLIEKRKSSIIRI